ncbi:hypothetical protein DYB25_013081, partial [Aphanomyces astaci]
MQSRSQFAAVTHAVAAPAPPPTAISQPDGSYHVLNAFTIPTYAHHDCVKIPGKCCFYCGVGNYTLRVCPTLKSDYVRNTMLAMVDMGVMTVAIGVALAVETAAVIVLAVTTAVLVVMTVTPATLLMMQSTVTLDAVVLRLLPTTPSYHPPSTVSSKSLNRLACYPKFLLRALPHCSTYLHRRRALHYLRLLRLLRLCHWRQLPSNRPHCQPTTGLPLTPVISTSLKSPLPQSVTYGPANFLALRDHCVVDSGASTSCTLNRDYFSRNVTCALFLTIGNGELPVVGYGAISMLVDMSSRDQVDDIRPCILRLNFGLHCPELQFNLFSVRQSSDDDFTVRFPARDVCEITISLGDVLNAPNNAMGLYSFPSQPKVVPTDPHHGESLHISDLTHFGVMMASFKTALRTFSTKYSGFSTFNDQLRMFAYSSVLRYARITHRSQTIYGPQVTSIAHSLIENRP